MSDSLPKINSPRVARYTDQGLIFRFLVLLLILLLHVHESNAQAGRPDTVSKYYSIVALGTAQNDSTIPYPQPIVFLEVRDTTNYRVQVRFPHLGILGLLEDTVRFPSLVTSNRGVAYCAAHPLLQLRFPTMEYAFWIDLIAKKSGRLIQSKRLPFNMDLDRYRAASFRIVHQATTDLSNQLLRRRFFPSVLPLSLEENPGWRALETLDSSSIYALRFENPADTNQSFLSITVTPSSGTRNDSASWPNFKMQARLAFGKDNIAVRPIGDFQISDKYTRRLLQRGYEFIARLPDSTYTYVATFALPNDVLLLVAPFDPKSGRGALEYLQLIARSLRVQGRRDSLSRQVEGSHKKNSR